MIARALRRLHVYVTGFAIVFIGGCGGPAIGDVVVSHDFGRVKVGQAISHEFSVVNSSGATWAVREVHKSCACIVGDVTKSTPPGDALRLPVGMTPAGEGGFGATFEIMLDNGPRILCVVSGQAVGAAHVSPAVVRLVRPGAFGTTVLRYPGKERPKVAISLPKGWIVDVGDWHAVGEYQEAPIGLACEVNVGMQRLEQVWCDLLHEDGRKEGVGIGIVLGAETEWPVSPRVLAIRATRGRDVEVRALVYPRDRIDRLFLRTGGESVSLPIRPSQGGIEVEFRVSEAPQELLLVSGKVETSLPIAKVWE